VCVFLAISDFSNWSQSFSARERKKFLRQTISYLSFNTLLILFRLSLFMKNIDKGTVKAVQIMQNGLFAFFSLYLPKFFIHRFSSLFTDFQVYLPIFSVICMKSFKIPKLKNKIVFVSVVLLVFNHFLHFLRI
jgi:hypothetical protein